MITKHSTKDEAHKEDYTYVYSRLADRSVWAKTAYYKDKYFFIWMPVMAVFFAMGFDFKTPAQATKQLQIQIDTLVMHNHLIDTSQVRLEGKINMILKINCLATKISPHDMQLAGLDCSKISNLP